MGCCKKIFIKAPFLKVKIFGKKAFKQNNLTLLEKLTYFILVFKELNSCKVSGLELLVLKNWPNLKKLFQGSYFESRLLDTKDFLVANFYFPECSRVFFIEIW